MKQLYLLLITAFFLNVCRAQVQSQRGIDANDSIEILRNLSRLFDAAAKPASYGLANIAVGNRLFSVKNYSLDAKQSNTHVLIYSPSLAYFHKSGLSLTGGANLLNDITGFGVNQYSLSPAFDLAGNKEWGFSFSYAHYFVRNKYSPFSSPIQNDLYSSIIYKKSWLRPGVAMGYSAGEYKEARHKDTAIGNARKHLYDSVTRKLGVFSLVVSAGHQFTWYGVFSGSDALALNTTLMANAGSGTTRITHKTNAVALFNFLNKRGRIPKFEQSNFQLQSIGLNLVLDYYLGDFIFEPQLYNDYYLPATDLKRFTQVFAFNVGYSF